jgi:hypothetical protein
MARYRSKPITIEATQWSPGRVVAGVQEDESGRPYVVTIHGQRAYLKPGDWVITEPDAEHHYPCKPDIFAARYEPAP